MDLFVQPLAPVIKVFVNEVGSVLQYEVEIRHCRCSLFFRLATIARGGIATLLLW